MWTTFSPGISLSGIGIIPSWHKFKLNFYFPCIYFPNARVHSIHTDGSVTVLSHGHHELPNCQYIVYLSNSLLRLMTKGKHQSSVVLTVCEGIHQCLPRDSIAESLSMSFCDATETTPGWRLCQLVNFGPGCLHAQLEHTQGAVFRTETAHPLQRVVRHINPSKPVSAACGHFY